MSKPGAQHARLSPSKGKLWSNCAGSTEAPDGPVSEASALGTAAAHHASEYLLHGTPVPAGFEQLSVYTDYVESVRERMSPCEWVAEVKYWHPAMPGIHYGTCDFAAWNTTMIFVCDLKWGTSVKVPAADNEQLQSYINLIQHKVGPRPALVGAICQPRTGRLIDVVEFSAEQIAAWDRTTLLASFLDDRVAGAHCWQGFCRLRSTCAEYAIWKQSKNR